MPIVIATFVSLVFQVHPRLPTPGFDGIDARGAPSTIAVRQRSRIRLVGKIKGRVVDVFG